MTEEEIKEVGEPGEIAETKAYGGIIELAPGMRFTQPRFPLIGLLDHPK